MEPLTPKQERVFKFIEQTVEQWNYPPSVREICKALGISSTATVHNYLNILVQKGYISRMPTKPRAIKIIKKEQEDRDRNCSFAPLVGKITAGKPIFATENREGYFPVPSAIAAGEGCFVLKVTGDSMSGAGIFDNDYVIIRHQNYANNGEIVALLLGEEATVKRFFKEKDHYRLQPANDAYEPLYAREVDVIGKVIGLFRKL